LVMKAWFRAVAAAFGDPAPAQTVAGLMLLILVLYTGYAIPKPSMIGALRWISYINVSGFPSTDSFFLCMVLMLL
jgi:ATP-binding cassette subfamily G (WHITE) protein 2 (SNQ2)